MRAQRQELAHAERRRAAEERAFAAHAREAVAALQAGQEAGDDRFQREQRSLGAERRQEAARRALWPADPHRSVGYKGLGCIWYTLYTVHPIPAATVELSCYIIRDLVYESG